MVHTSRDTKKSHKVSRRTPGPPRDTLSGKLLKIQAFIQEGPPPHTRKTTLRAYPQGHNRALRRARPTDRDRPTPRSPRSPLECLKNRDLKGTHHKRNISIYPTCNSNYGPSLSVIFGALCTHRTCTRLTLTRIKRTLARSILHGAKGSAKLLSHPPTPNYLTFHNNTFTLHSYTTINHLLSTLPSRSGESGERFHHPRQLSVRCVARVLTRNLGGLWRK